MCECSSKILWHYTGSHRCTEVHGYVMCCIQGQGLTCVCVCVLSGLCNTQWHGLWKHNRSAVVCQARSCYCWRRLSSAEHAFSAWDVLHHQRLPSHFSLPGLVIYSCRAGLSARQSVSRRKSSENKWSKNYGERLHHKEWIFLQKDDVVWHWPLRSIAVSCSSSAVMPLLTIE